MSPGCRLDQRLLQMCSCGPHPATTWGMFLSSWVTGAQEAKSNYVNTFHDAICFKMLTFHWPTQLTSSWLTFKLGNGLE